MRTLYNVHVERGKYENQIGSRGQETPDLRPKDVFVRRLGLAGARGRPNGHSVEHHGYNIHISRLQFARTSAVIKNTLIIISLLNVCGPCVSTCAVERWSRIGVYPAFMTRRESLIGAVSSSVIGHLHFALHQRYSLLLCLCRFQRFRQGILYFLGTWSPVAALVSAGPPAV